MTNEEYLGSEGLHLLALALASCCDSRHDGDVAHGLTGWLKRHGCFLSEDEAGKMNRFMMDYIILRLYMCFCMIRDFHAGLGAKRSLLRGLEEIFSDLPMHMKMKYLENRLSGGCFMIAGPWGRYTKAYIKERFARFAAIEGAHREELPKEEALRRTMEESLEEIASLCRLPLSFTLRSYFIKETESYMRALSQRLSELTPQGIYKKARSRTLYGRAHVWTEENVREAWPSLMTAASMMCGLLYMLA